MGGPVGFFNWAAPLFGRFADRWSSKSIDEIAGWLTPYLRGPCPENCEVLDVGGGTGALARRLHEATGARVTVLDPTPEMLRYVPTSGAVHGVLGSAETMPFSDDTFDVVVVTDAFHHFRDQGRAASEFRRVVKAGGGVLVVELDPRGPLMRAIVWSEKMLGEPGAFYTPHDMCRFMSEHGVIGTCSRMKAAAYRFIGTVRK